MTTLMYDYDIEGDSLFIYCDNPYEYEVSLELDNDVILDLDSEGEPVPFEFLNASKVFKINKNYFKNLVKICIHTDISEESISLNVRIHDKNKTYDINHITSNLNELPSERKLVSA